MFQLGDRIGDITEQVDMMFYESMPILWFYKENIGHAFELPYANDKYSMWVF